MLLGKQSVKHTSRLSKLGARVEISCYSKSVFSHVLHFTQVQNFLEHSTNLIHIVIGSSSSDQYFLLSWWKLWFTGNAWGVSCAGLALRCWSQGIARLIPARAICKILKLEPKLAMHSDFFLLYKPRNSFLIPHCHFYMYFQRQIAPYIYVSSQFKKMFTYFSHLIPSMGPKSYLRGSIRPYLRKRK